jgi:calcineurin-like phosphoesterase family protein
MSTVYYISDCHFGHKNILKYRPEFSSIKEHDNTIMENILSTINKRSTLIMLGDMFFTNEEVYTKGNIIRKIAGYTHLVLGNHDSDNPIRAENVGQMWAIFNSVHGIIKRNGFWLSHAPIHPEELRGSKNIHGHVHAHTLDDERYINVCCENVRYKPVSLEDIRAGWRTYE